jgi:hypothetical protein
MNCHFFTWQIRFLSLFRLVLLIFGFAAMLTSGALAQWSTTDLISGKPLPSGTTNNQVVWQVGNYVSDNLQIYGLICTPPASITGPYPVAILNHGDGGAGNVWMGCTLMAQYGWLTAISAYRGESLSAPGFQGKSQSVFGLPDICNGDVDDVRNLLSIVTAMTDANGTQVFMWGHSEGSCITELAIEKGAKVQIAVSIDGPTDFTTWSNAPKPLIPPNPNERSSAWVGNNPTALRQVTFLRVQAEGDEVVSPDQACKLASTIPTNKNYYLNSAVTPPGVYYGVPKECSSYAMPWVNWPPPSKATGHGQVLPDEGAGGVWAPQVMLMYSGLSHTAIPAKAWPEIASFVNAFAKSRGWRASLPSAFVPFE